MAVVVAALLAPAPSASATALTVGVLSLRSSPVRIGPSPRPIEVFPNGTRREP